MANVCFLHSSLAHTCCILVLNNHQNQLYCYQSTCKTQQPYFHHNFISSTHFSTILSTPTHVCKCKSRFRNSNAESYTFSPDTEIENDDFDMGLAVFEEYIDSIWIFKVFGSYGWMSPVILISWLLATGLKAFLITLAFPILQSTFTFAFQKMQGKSKTSPELKTKKTYKTKKRSLSRSSYRSQNGKTKEESTRGDEYGSWSSEMNGSVHRSEGSRAEFGGWDELDAGTPRRRTKNSSGIRGSSRKKSKLRSGLNTNDTTPLLLRLLVSIFPFLEFLE